ncbi:hypothetical protein ABTK64_20490, partial [Acinetobacter baumannii]
QHPAALPGAPAGGGSPGAFPEQRHRGDPADPGPGPQGPGGAGGPGALLAETHGAILPAVLAGAAIVGLLISRGCSVEVKHET